MHGCVQTLPGNVSSMMSVVIGKRFFGFWGSLLALLGFLLPAFLIVVGWMIFGEFIYAQWKAMKLEVLPKVLLFLGTLLLAYVGVQYRLIELEILGAALLMDLVLYRVFPSFFRPQSKINLYFLKCFRFDFFASVIVFGTGFMLFPYLERELV